jgi:hypothetical protein
MWGQIRDGGTEVRDVPGADIQRGRRRSITEQSWVREDKKE